MYWSHLRQALRERLNEQAFATWIQPMSVLEETETQLKLGLPDAFGLDWVENHYRDVLEQELRRLAPEAKLSLQVDQTSSSEAALDRSLAPAAPVLEAFKRISERYTFTNFVTGPSNQLAAAAAQTVATNPGRAYNPLFVFGRVGLGKTHLIQAIGHTIMQARPEAVVRYLTTEQFVNDVVTGIQNKRMHEIRSLYRACDVLLIDDIQFIAGKEACQDEFFHTFNTLHAAEKQVVVTSDKLPHEIKDLEDRIRSRFQWGLIVDLQPPELETRMAIVRAKAESDGIPLDDDVALFIAQSVRSNVRELEGCLIRVSAYAALTQQPMSVELAKNVLRDILPGKSQLTCELILRATAHHFEVKISELKSTKRARAISLPRQVAMYLCRKHTEASYPEIGRALGGRDHTTAINAFRRIEERSQEPELHRHLEEIEHALLDR
ncbi:MAG: chromosomal replication initiator protein DnaA [Myxococcota bacterium]